MTAAKTSFCAKAKNLASAAMPFYYVYILTNKSGTLYVGVTNDLERRVYEHKHGAIDSFTKRYKLDRLLYYDVAPDAQSAIVREIQIKGWVRRKKIELIKSMNPRRRDLAETWCGEGPDPSLRSG